MTEEDLVGWCQLGYNTFWPVLTAQRQGHSQRGPCPHCQLRDFFTEKKLALLGRKACFTQ